MKHYLHTARLLVVACAASFCASCAHPIAGIMYPGAKRVALIKSETLYPSVLMSVDEQNRTLRYMTKDDAHDQYLVRTYDFRGHLVSKTPFPKFSDSCWGWFGYGATRGGAVSPDCRSVAYLDIKNPSDKQSQDLCWFNARTGARTVLVKHFAREVNSLECLRWVSDRELLVAVDEYGQPEARLLLIDIEEPSIRFDLPCRNLRLDQFMLSHFGRYLAYWEGLGRYASRGSFKILDLRERKEVAVSEPGEPAVFGSPKWSPEDDALVYVMDHKLIRFLVASRRSDVLKSFDPHVDIALQDYRGKRLYYRVEPRDTRNPLIRLHCFDLTTQEETQFRNHPEGPFHAFVCSDDTIIYYILGQEPL